MIFLSKMDSHSLFLLDFAKKCLTGIAEIFLVILIDNSDLYIVLESIN
jgi:hypothetical protein